MLAMLTEPRMFKLGSSSLLFMLPSATPMSDHLNGASARVVVRVRTNPIFASFSLSPEQIRVGERKNHEFGIAWTTKPTSVAHGIESATWERNQLIVLCHKETR